MSISKKTTTGSVVYKYSGLLILVEVCVFIPFIILLLVQPKIFYLLKGNPLWLFGCMGLSFNLLETGVLYNSVALKALTFIPAFLKILCAMRIFKKNKKFAIIAGVLYFFDFLSVLIRLLSNGIQIHGLTFLEISISFFLCVFPAIISTVLFETIYHFDRESDYKLLPKNKQKQIAIKVFSYLVALLIVASVTFLYVYNNGKYV